MVLIGNKTLADLRDVNISAETDLEILQQDGVNWSNLVSSRAARIKTKLATQTIQSDSKIKTPHKTTNTNTAEITAFLKFIS